MCAWTPHVCTFEFDVLDLEEIQKEYPNLLATVQKEFPHLPLEDQVKIVSLAVDTCPYCHSEHRGCQCWNDE